MSVRITKRICFLAHVAILLVAVWSPARLLRAAPLDKGQQTSAGAPHVKWESPAILRHGFLSKTRGTLALTDVGVEFRAVKGPNLLWRFEEIQTFHASPYQLWLTGYENRGWHLSGDRSFQINFETQLPASVAAELAARIGKPSENGAPNPSSPAFATLGARHRTRGGGTNGTLRFRDSGIDYVTISGRGARSWRWADIETIARPDAFHFRVGGYRETYEFELKEPMSRVLFDKLWNDVYGRGLKGLSMNGGVRP